MPGGMPPTPSCEDDCPARPPALRHAHGQSCDHNEPNDICCHCRRRFRHPATCRHWETDKASKQARTVYDEPMQRRREQHEFRFTVTGRCGRNGCGKLEGEHLRYFKNEVQGCIVDHLSVPTEHDGAGWSRCGECGFMVEECLIESKLPGPVDAIGRGEPSEKQLNEWVRIRKAWNAGYYLS